MNIHEYQAKSLFAAWGLPVPKGVACSSGEEAAKAYETLKSAEGKAVAKCQVHAGGRGKAGGVKLVSSAEEASQFADNMLGKRLVTFQTGPDGQPVSKVLIEECGSIEREIYIGMTIDRALERIVFMASPCGGVEIEKVASETPELIYKEVIDPVNGGMPYQAREIAFKLGFSGATFKQFVKLFDSMCRMYSECDCSLLEVNPLVVDKDGNLVCLDAKMNIDNNALFRHQDILNMRDESQETPIEAEAQSNGLSFVQLDGNIGCMVNGAGLAMGTMDTIKLLGGNPANFLDVGGAATKERVIKAFELILSEPKVKAVLVNIFGGIVRCDLIAEGIVGAVKEVGIKIPVVVRLEGNGAEKGLALLEESGMNIRAVGDLKGAVEAAVKAAEEGSL